MRNHIKKKLREIKGETISEVLVALLISSLALVMLAGMINATSNLVTKSKAKMKDYYDANEALESMAALPAQDAKASKVENFEITITGTNPVLNVSVPKKNLTCYVNTQLGKPVYSYSYSYDG